MPYKNPQTRKEYAKMYLEKNRDKINARIRKWSEGEEASRKKQEYREKNREVAREYHKQYSQTEYRKNYLKKFFSDYYVKRAARDPSYRLKNLLSHRIYVALKGSGKSKKTMELVGCTIEQLWDHLEKQFKPEMTKENYGTWHVDHIRPCASFDDLTDPKQQAECFHYTNLQPLWAHQNISKGAKYES